MMPTLTVVAHGGKALKKWWNSTPQNKTSPHSFLNFPQDPSGIGAWVLMQQGAVQMLQVHVNGSSLECRYGDQGVSCSVAEAVEEIATLLKQMSFWTSDLQMQVKPLLQRNLEEINTGLQGIRSERTGKEKAWLMAQDLVKSRDKVRPLVKRVQDLLRTI